MRTAFGIAIGIAALMTVAQAQNNGQARGNAQARPNAQARNDIPHINPGSPTVPDAEIDSHPIPRMPDGHPDLTGPWVGGGSNGDIEREGGLKPGELPLQQ